MRINIWLHTHQHWIRKKWSDWQWGRQMCRVQQIDLYKVVWLTLGLGCVKDPICEPPLIGWSYVFTHCPQGWKLGGRIFGPKHAGHLGQNYSTKHLSYAESNRPLFLVMGWIPHRLKMATTHPKSCLCGLSRSFMTITKKWSCQ